jgi:SAM-dependent methyltransferase
MGLAVRLRGMPAWVSWSSFELRCNLMLKNNLVTGVVVVAVLALHARSFAGEAAGNAPPDDVAATQSASLAASKAAVERAYARKDPAQELDSIAPLVHFESVNSGEPAGDRMGAPRRLAAAIVAHDNASPRLIVDVGSFTGEFLEAFLQRFPNSRGQWTEPVTSNEANARKRLGRFGRNVDYVIGCPSRDISLGCVPKGVDVLLTSWLSIHQDLVGIRKFYQEAGRMLPPGGWVAVLDHVSDGGEPWRRGFQAAREELAPAGLIGVVEGPPAHHADFHPASVDQHLAALRAAGFEEGQVIWRRLDTALIMARKH